FFPQLFGTVLALACFLIVLRYRRRPRIAAPFTIVAGCGVLPFADGISAAWFVVAAWLLMVFSYPRTLPGPLRRQPIAAAVLGVLLLALLAANPAFRSSWDLVGTNGSFQFELPFGGVSTNLSENVPALIAIVGVLTAIALLSILAVEGVPARNQVPRVIVSNA